jgi:hypothetical protein
MRCVRKQENCVGVNEGPTASLARCATGLCYCIRGFAVVAAAAPLRRGFFCAALVGHHTVTKRAASR